LFKSQPRIFAREEILQLAIEVRLDLIVRARIVSKALNQQPRQPDPFAGRKREGFFGHGEIRQCHAEQISRWLARRKRKVFRHPLGLALNETGQLDAASAALEEAVKLDPRFARAWYNLGLAYSAQEKTGPALDALVRAESLDARSAQIPYARATILARLGRTDEARAAARRALELQSSFREAAELLQVLGR